MSIIIKNMGTHFRLAIIIKSRKIIMHGNYDGYLDYTGKNICDAIKRLLNEIGYDELCILINKLEPIYIDIEDIGKDGDGILINPNLESPENYAIFDLICADMRKDCDYIWTLNSAFIYNIIKSGKYIYDGQDLGEYEYTIDLNNKKINVKYSLSYMDEIIPGDYDLRYEPREESLTFEEICKGEIFTRDVIDE